MRAGPGFWRDSQWSGGSRYRVVIEVDDDPERSRPSIGQGGIDVVHTRRVHQTLFFLFA